MALDWRECASEYFMLFLIEWALKCGQWKAVWLLIVLSYNMISILTFFGELKKKKKEQNTQHRHGPVWKVWMVDIYSQLLWKNLSLEGTYILTNTSSVPITLPLSIVRWEIHAYITMSVHQSLTSEVKCLTTPKLDSCSLSVFLLRDCAK